MLCGLTIPCDTKIIAGDDPALDIPLSVERGIVAVIVSFNGHVQNVINLQQASGLQALHWMYLWMASVDLGVNRNVVDNLEVPIFSRRGRE